MSELASASLRTAHANKGFGAIFAASMVVHVAVFGGYFFLQMQGRTVPAFTQSIPVQLVQLGKKRDPKLLPRKVEEAPAAAPDEGVALDMKSDAAKKPDPAKKKPEKKLSDRAKQLLEGTASDSKMEKALSKIEDREGDPDGDIHGTTTDSTNAATGYQRAILQQLQSSYRLPETIPASQRQFLKAQVVLYIERDGSVSRYEFIQRHPNEMFMAALESMLKTIKMPPPPPAIADSVHDGVQVNFHL